MTHPIHLNTLPPDDPIVEFLRQHFDLTPAEIAQTTISFDEEENCLGIQLDFGEGLQNTPERTAHLLRLLRISGREASAA